MKIEKAKEHLKKAERMIVLSYLFKEARIMSYALEELCKSAISIMPWLYKKDFLDKKDLKEIWDIIKIHGMHKKAAVEFTKNDKLVILLNDKYEVLTKEKLEIFLKTIKKAISIIEGL